MLLSIMTLNEMVLSITLLSIMTLNEICLNVAFSINDIYRNDTQQFCLSAL